MNTQRLPHSVRHLISFVPLLGLVCLLMQMTGCATKPSVATSPPPATPMGEIADLHTFPQDLQVYADALSASGGAGRLISVAEQQTRNARYDELFFGPWTQTKASVKAKDAYAILGTSSKTSKPRGYAENLLPWTRENWQRLVNNADRRGYPSRAERGIIVRPTSVRELPTHSPRFAHPSDPGQGFPFDLFAYSTFPVGMPVFITHRSKDRLWSHVENALVSGWVWTKDLAVVDDAFMQHYQNGRYGVVVRENVPLLNAQGSPLAEGQIGTLLPLENDGKTLFVLVPARDGQGRAHIARAEVSSDDVAQKPLPLTAQAVAQVGNQMMDKPYGWGGLLGNRDCSQLLRDLFTPFGVWLPRNSQAQAKAWDFIPLSGSPQDKENTILQQGKPFATLLWLKGHIGLYIGEYQGQAAMYHAFWAIRTKPEMNQGRKVSGRYVIGRTVITSTKPGIELPNASSTEGLLDRMLGMSVLE